MKLSITSKSALVVVAMLVSFASLADEVFWVDVRSPQEFAQSHVVGAVNIPHEQIREQISTATDDKKAPIYLYCGSGYRSGIAMNYLQSMGYTQARNVGGLEDAIKLQAEEKPEG
ncbi:MAG: rhodanese-like domain-containing protein [Halioglobus sp.]